MRSNSTGNGYHSPARTVKNKWIEVKEIQGEGKLELEIGQRVVDSRIIHEVVELKQPSGLGSPTSRTHTPEYKTIVVLECVEFEYE